MKNLAIFASGNGSNAENIIKHFRGSNIANVKIVICNKETAPVIDKARKLDVQAVVLPREELVSETPAALLSLLQQHNIEMIILAGYLLKIPQILTSTYKDRIINIHPALLPKFGGKGMYGMNVHKTAIAAGETESGITIHLVDAVYDNGKTLFQARCPIFPTDTPEDLAARVHSLEYEHYPAVIEEYLRQLFL